MYSIFEKPPLDELMHYGVKRRSGRYPWGSGDNPYQHSGDFLSRVNELKGQGLTEKEICETLGMTTTDYRMQVRVANHERRALEADRARSLREDGLSLNQIAEKMGYANDSSIRSLLNESTAASKNAARATAERLKQELEEKGILDVGAGVEKELGVSQNTLKEALFILETEGYKHFGVGMPQVTNPRKRKFFSDFFVHCPPLIAFCFWHKSHNSLLTIGLYTCGIIPLFVRISP